MSARETKDRSVVGLLPHPEASEHRRVLTSNREGSILKEDLDERFEELRRLVEAWSRETIALVRPYAHLQTSESRKPSRVLERSFYSKWFFEILIALHPGHSARFEELHKACKGISSRVLSKKLRVMENSGLIQRRVLATRPPRAQYALTEKGITLTALGTPVILFLRLKEGSYVPQSPHR